MFPGRKTSESWEHSAGQAASMEKGKRRENDTSEPVDNNLNFCEQCYCYICDKPVSKCEFWKVPSLCHCNAHNKSKYWKAHRDAALKGTLSMFNFNLVDIDAELRRGGELLQKFSLVLAVEYNKYLMGMSVPNHTIPCTCSCHNVFNVFCEKCLINHFDIRLYSYTAVFELVDNFLCQADQEKPKAAVVMMMGAAKEILFHKQLSQVTNTDLNLMSSTPKLAVPFFMHRIANSLQKMLVLSDFPPCLFDKLKRFYQTLPFPSFCFAFTNSLNVLSWDDPFLTSILRGQNITGQRQKKGRKEVLWEEIVVIQARVERMEAREEYRELVRYLRVVKCSDTLKLQALQDKVPFYICKYGDFHHALQAFHVNSSLSCCTACRLSPIQYSIYLKILKTETVPPGSDLSEEGNWVCVKGDSSVKIHVMMRSLLRILFVNKALYKDVQCWSKLIEIQCNSFTLGKNGKLLSEVIQAPSAEFVESTAGLAAIILEDLKKGIVGLPKVFLSVDCKAAMLILVTIAFVQMWHTKLPTMYMVLQLLLAYGRNVWALKLLLDKLRVEEENLRHFCILLGKNLYMYKGMLLEGFKCHDAGYVCDFVNIFLSDTHPCVQANSMQMVQILVEAWQELKGNECVWEQTLHSFLQNKVIPAIDRQNAKHLPELRNKINMIALKKV
ncbi:uncharacterized protein zgc:112980 isoform X2 [Callorhinchus milii]|uniref:uncharacterized protein zgc:112980 isoform X2 n=1 Tax=Callorhinchus milii TaxID=7868 RepID=UPI0004574BC5|nr:uncharacterized protein zgc:112980 isoform X2 [Callorhinchus milii]|eukprot:gi/632975562/ref/XP_007904298.1/ PREDICTED: uncharacterized protein LOC103186855 isoform X2 [Callorhinchus milii]